MSVDSAMRQVVVEMLDVHSFCLFLRAFLCVSLSGLWQVLAFAQKLSKVTKNCG